MKLDGYARLYLSGGGLKVASFLGSLELIDLASLRWIYGLSAGSVIACLLVLGATVPQLQELFLASEWTRILSAALHPGQLLSRKGLLDKRCVVAFITSLLDQAAVPRDSTLQWLRRTRDVGFGCFFEFRFCFWISRIFVWMPLHGSFSVCFFDFIIRSTFVDS